MRCSRTPAFLRLASSSTLLPEYAPAPRVPPESAGQTGTARAVRELRGPTSRAVRPIESQPRCRSRRPEEVRTPVPGLAIVAHTVWGAAGPSLHDPNNRLGDALGRRRDLAVVVEAGRLAAG